jgi:hypothetical protein
MPPTPPLPKLLRLRHLLAALMAALSMWAQAQGVDLHSIIVRRADSALRLDFGARLNLPAAVMDALQRGVPMYFVADASLYRSRWYWRDERVAHVTRTWRLSYQPLTGSWRVALGALSQTFATLPEALQVVSSASGWPITETDHLDRDERYYVEFRYGLDNAQLPRPMQIDIGNDWKVGIERKLRFE